MYDSIQAQLQLRANALSSEMEVMTDRLAELQCVKDVSIDLEDEDTDCTIVSPASIDGFLETVNQMNRNTERIQENLDEMRQIQENVLESRVNKKRSELTNEIKKISLNVYEGLKRLNEEIKCANELGTNRHDAELRIKKSQEAALRQKLKKLVFEYKQLEEQHKAKCKEMLRRQQQITGVRDDISDDRLSKLVPPIESGEALIQQEILNRERQTLKEVEARKIFHLEKNVKELHDMFDEMVVLLKDESQDENDLADNIQYNVENKKDMIVLLNDESQDENDFIVNIENTKDDVPKVTGPIEIARNYTKKSSLKWAICGIGTIVMVIFLLIITLPVALVIIIIISIIVITAASIGSCRHQETQDQDTQDD